MIVLLGMRAKLKCLTIQKEECAEFDGVQKECHSRINLVTNFMKKLLFSFFTESS